MSLHYLWGDCHVHKWGLRANKLGPSVFLQFVPGEGLRLLNVSVLRIKQCLFWKYTSKTGWAFLDKVSVLERNPHADQVSSLSIGFKVHLLSCPSRLPLSRYLKWRPTKEGWKAGPLPTLLVAATTTTLQRCTLSVSEFPFLGTQFSFYSSTFLQSLLEYF